MYDKLKKYLLGYLPENYWYDEGVDIARDIISNFTENDWKLLLEQLSEQNIEWIEPGKNVKITCGRYTKWANI